MSRGLSAGVLAKLYAVSTDDPLYALLTVTHPSITTRRHVRNTEDVVSRLETFTAASFDVQMPEQKDDAPPTSTLVIDAVDQSVIRDLLAINSPAEILVELVLASAPDAVLSSFKMKGRAAQWNVSTASIELSANPVLDEQYPGISHTPARFPGMFRG